jgi:hypothetical protein
MDIVHLIAQYAHHDNAAIVANKLGLIRLREAIDEAIETGSSGVGTFASDGEGYILLVSCVDDFDGISMPYTADYCSRGGACFKSQKDKSAAFEKANRRGFHMPDTSQEK